MNIGDQGYLIETGLRGLRGDKWIKPPLVELIDIQHAVLSERGKDLHDILMDVMGDCVLSDGMRSEIVRLVKLWEEGAE